jgi:quinol monooxygenase YgiN
LADQEGVFKLVAIRPLLLTLCPYAKSLDTINYSLMTVLTAYVNFQPGKIEAALQACRTVRGQSVQEPGCERYDFFQSTDDAAKIVFVEEWTTKADLDLHFLQPAFLEFSAAIQDLLVSPPEIRIFEAALHP